MSPSPAISFDVSTTTTRLSSSSASTRAASRSIVVLPMPGRPMISTLFPDSTRSLMISIVPNTARPMRAVRPTILPLRLRIALMRCSVRSMPARLSSPNEPMWSMTYWMSSSVDLALEQHLLAARAEARLGRAAEVHHDLDHVAFGRNGADSVGDLGRQRHKQRFEVAGAVVGAGGGHVCHVAFVLGNRSAQDSWD